MQMLAALFDTLRSVPAVIWSGVIGAGLAFGGVLISNRSNTARLRIQLEHDAREKARERTATLRRDVYLAAADEMVKASSFLAALPQADLGKTSVSEGLQGFFGAASKLQLVAESGTALLVSELTARYTDLFLHLMARIIPLQEVRAEIGVQDALYDKVQAQVTRVLDDMAKLNESGKPAAAAFEALQRAFDGYQAQARTHADARSAAWARFQALNVEFCRQLFEDLRVTGELQASVMVEIRHDLGLTTDLETYRSQMMAQWATASAQLQAVLDSLGKR